MHWSCKLPERPGLRSILLALLLPLLACITLLELWMTDHDAKDAANSAYDRSLMGAARSIAANISTASGGLAVELPYRMFEFFELTANGQVYFRVASSDGLVELGSADLPMPAVSLAPEVPVFYDAVYFGEAVRLVAFLTRLEAPGVQGSAGTAQQVLIQVAENIQSRQDFTSRFVARTAWRDAIILVMTLLCVALTVTFALQPLARLAAQVRGRQADDLTPLPAAGLPSEVHPLVLAVNQQMQRLMLQSLQQREFVDDASHQLRTHLTTLHMQVDYLLAQRAYEHDGQQMQQALLALRHEIERSTHTTNQLLSLARSEACELNWQPFELAAVVREVAISCMPQARARQLDLGAQENTGSLQAMGDRDLLREALLNMAANAIAHTPPHGEVTLMFAADPMGWSLGVSDSGPGLSENERRTLGRRFLRKASGEQPGSGLGLAIVRAIAEKHGGVLRLDARDGQSGLHASIWWPRQPAHSADSALVEMP